MIKYHGYIIGTDDLCRLYIYNTHSPYSADGDKILIRAANYKDAKRIVDARITSGQDVRDIAYLR